MEIFVGILALILIIAGFVYFKIIKPNQIKQKFAAEAKKREEAFIEAKKSGDKAKALETGRAYYSFLRGGTLTIYDEQSLNNDIAVMK
jgi:flagellar biosynthesis/type III secretory pathway M-ring protein FliF/YscJ